MHGEIKDEVERVPSLMEDTFQGLLGDVEENFVIQMQNQTLGIRGELLLIKGLLSGLSPSLLEPFGITNELINEGVRMVLSQFPILMDRFREAMEESSRRDQSRDEGRIMMLSE
jgi:hypothetical protein